MNKVDFCIKATKECTKALMKISFKNYCNNGNFTEDKISNKNIHNNNY